MVPAVDSVKTALITGAAGFIGSSFLRHLDAESWDIEVCDIAFPFPNSIDCRRFFAESEKRYDLVIHAAAVVGGRAQIDGNPIAVADSMAIDIAAWQWALRTRPHRFVYFSSSAAYPVYLQGDKGGIDQRTLRESDIDHKLPELADQTYGLCKQVGERLALIVQDSGVPVTILRPFSGYGPTQSSDYPFGAFIDRAQRKARPFEIWGDGDSTRDWIFVDDIVAGTMAAIETGIATPVNLCTGVGTTFNNLARMVTKAAGYEPLYEYLLTKPQGVRHRVGDPTLLNKFYTPTVTLQEGVDRAMQVALAE